MLLVEARVKIKQVPASNRECDWNLNSIKLSYCTTIYNAKYIFCDFYYC